MTDETKRTDPQAQPDAEPESAELEDADLDEVAGGIIIVDTKDSKDLLSSQAVTDEENRTWTEAGIIVQKKSLR